MKEQETKAKLRALAMTARALSSASTELECCKPGNRVELILDCESFAADILLQIDRLKPAVRA